MREIARRRNVLVPSAAGRARVDSLLLVDPGDVGIGDRRVGLRAVRESGGVEVRRQMRLEQRAGDGGQDGFQGRHRLENALFRAFSNTLRTTTCRPPRICGGNPRPR